MAYLSHPDFTAVHTAITELVDNRVHTDLHPDDVKLLVEAKALLDAAHEAVADPALAEEARDLHGSDEIEIDDEGAGTSVADDGVWVQAWVWVPTASDECATCAASIETRVLPCDECGEMDHG